MDDQQELRLRRQAMRLYLKGVRLKVILEKVQRSRAWFSKWRKRFDQQGTAGLRSHSRRPHHMPITCSLRIERLIVRTRRRLVKQKVGLSGPRAIQRELRKLGLGQQMPSLSTILRVLHRRGLLRTSAKVPPAYFPKPLTVMRGTLQALDWTCRYLEDGPKVYAFHTLNLRTRACHQTIAGDKSGETVMIGGLIRSVDMTIVRKVPLLGDLPIVGYLFRHKTTSKQKVDLMIFITPHLLES